MVYTLCFDIYGIKLRVRTQNFAISEFLKKIFFPFHINCSSLIHYDLDHYFDPKFSVAEIIPVINPLFCKKEFWIFHSAAVTYKGKGFVFMGRSGAGKTTLTKISLKLGLKIIGDDLILLKKCDKEVKILPMFFALQKKDKSLFDIISLKNFCKKAYLSAIFVLSGITDRSSIELIKKKSVRKKEIYKNILWGLDEVIVKKQLFFVEELLAYPIYYFYSGKDILDNPQMLIQFFEKVI